jgi:hypothetical protein
MLRSPLRRSLLVKNVSLERVQFLMVNGSLLTLWNCSTRYNRNAENEVPIEICHCAVYWTQKNQDRIRAVK